jgi:hypothetical protein
MVPLTEVPFLSSITTDSLLSFMRNRTSFILTFFNYVMVEKNQLGMFNLFLSTKKLRVADGNFTTMSVISGVTFT